MKGLGRVLSRVILAAMAALPASLMAAISHDASLEWQTPVFVTETATDEKGKAIGARVVSVDPRSPLAGVADGPKKGDLVTSLIVKGSTKKIYTASDLREVLSVLGAGTSVTLKWKSGRRYGRWKGELGDRTK